MNPRTTPVGLPAAVWAPLLREALARAGRFRWQLRGRSMTPTLPTACEIEVASLPDPPPIGAVVVFAGGETLIAHRLVGRAGARWVTQGDGSLAPDPPLTTEQLLGVALAAYRDGRRCWPGPLTQWLTGFWIARYHALRPLRFAWRTLRCLRRCYKPGDRGRS